MRGQGCLDSPLFLFLFPPFFFFFTKYLVLMLRPRQAGRPPNQTDYGLGKAPTHCLAPRRWSGRLLQHCFMVPNICSWILKTWKDWYASHYLDTHYLPIYKEINLFKIAMWRLEFSITLAGFPVIWVWQMIEGWNATFYISTHKERTWRARFELSMH